VRSADNASGPKMHSATTANANFIRFDGMCSCEARGSEAGGF
jgi:hypothetical protein